MAATALGWGARRSVVRRPALGADDRWLVAQVRAGDDDAFEAIYDRYARGLLAFCRHLLASRDEAEDALQHSFGAAYTMLRSTDRDVELRPWLYTIARNRCLSLLRARRKEISLDGAPECGGAADGLADEVQRRSDLRELLEDLRRLPDDQRGALVLFEFGGLPHDEIAAVLDVRREKVKALIFQAREGLIRARHARDLPCTEMREQLATHAGKVPARSMLRRHVDRCRSCARFEDEVGRQRAGLALILPVLPTAGLKSIVLGSVLGRGAAVVGGGAGGGAAVLGGTGGGGGGLACAGAGSGAAGLAGAGVSTGAGAGGAILAGGVSGTLATAGGAGTLAAALGATSAGGVAKLLAVAAVVVGGGTAGAGDLRPSWPGGDTPAVQQKTPSAAVPSPLIQELIAPPGRPAGDPALDPGSTAAPAPAHDPPAPTASDPALVSAATSQTTPILGDPMPAAPIGSLPAGVGTNAGAAQPPAAGTTPTTPPPDPAGHAPPATSAPAPAPTAPAGTTTVGGGALVPDAPATSQSTTTVAAPPAGGDPATTSEPHTTAGAPATGGAPTTGSAPATGSAPVPASGATTGAATTPAPAPEPQTGATTPADEPPGP